MIIVYFYCAVVVWHRLLHSGQVSTSCSSVLHHAWPQQPSTILLIFCIISLLLNERFLRLLFSICHFWFVRGCSILWIFVFTEPDLHSEAAFIGYSAISSATVLLTHSYNLSPTVVWACLVESTAKLSDVASWSDFRCLNPNFYDWFTCL